MKDFVNYTGKTEEIPTQNAEIESDESVEPSAGIFSTLDSKTVTHLLIFIAVAVVIKKLLIYLYKNYMAVPTPKPETKKNK